MVNFANYTKKWVEVKKYAEKMGSNCKR
jgi:hypothetical protein